MKRMFMILSVFMLFGCSFVPTSSQNDLLLSRSDIEDFVCQDKHLSDLGVSTRFIPLKEKMIKVEYDDPGCGIVVSYKVFFLPTSGQAQLKYISLRSAFNFYSDLKEVEIKSRKFGEFVKLKKDGRDAFIVLTRTRDVIFLVSYKGSKDKIFALESVFSNKFRLVEGAGSYH